MNAETRIDTIGIIGAGHLGQAFARTVPDMKPAELDGRSSSASVAELDVGARVVKTANTLAAADDL